MVAATSALIGSSPRPLGDQASCRPEAPLLCSHRMQKVDPLQVLLHGPSVLVCAGNEAFRPPAMDSAQRGGTEALSSLTSSSKNGCWGPKAKPSVIHPRSRSGSRLPRSLSSARSGLNEPPTSLPRAWMGASLPGPLVTSDNVEKQVHMNEDGSLSVEMRVRLHLLGEDAMLWSQRVGQASGEGPSLKEVDPNCCRWEGHSWDSLEPGGKGPGLCKAGCRRAFEGPRSSFEIWRNPLCAPLDVKPAPWRRPDWGQSKKRCGKDYSSPASSAERPGGSDSDSCSPRTPEGHADSDSPSPASEAASFSWAEQAGGEARCPEGAQPPGWEQQTYQAPGTRAVERALLDSSASARSHKESSKWEGQQWGGLGRERTGTSQLKATLGDNPCCLSLNNEDPQPEKCGQDAGCPEAMDGPVTTLPLAQGSAGSQDAEGLSLRLPACALALRRRRRQQSPGSTTSSSCTPVLQQATQRSHTRLCLHCGDPHCPTDSPEPPPAPRPPDRRSTSPGGPVPRSSPKSSSSSRQVSGNQGALPCSPAPQAAIAPVSSSDGASDFYHPRACSAEPAGDTEGRVHPSWPTPTHTSGAGGLGDETGSTSRPSPPLSLQAGWPEGEEPGAHHSGPSSQTGVCPVLRTPSDHTEACWASSGYCPTPPQGRPCTMRHPSNHSGHQRTGDEGPRASETGEETLQVGHMLAPSPQSGTMGSTAREAGRSPSPAAGAGTEEPREDGGMTPSALPHASPDAVVREWLDNIPEEPVLLGYGMVDEATPVSHDSLGSTEEDAGDTRQQVPEGDPDEQPTQDQGLPGTVQEDPDLGDGPHQGTGLDEGPKDTAKAGVGDGVPVGCGLTLCSLPGRVSASTQIMKALMGTKQGRPSSLPELSGPMAQRLSRSAEALVTCLASLRFFDGACGALADTGRLKDSPQYQELLGLFQGLWPGCDLGQGPVDPDLKALPITKDFTPTSSSGVDVSSGSGGSGDGGVPCAMEAAPGPQQMEQSLQISSQRPSSSSSGHPEHRENPQQSCSTASSGSPVQEEARSSSREQTSDDDLEQLDNNPEPSVENRTQEERGPAEESKERERPQEEGVQEEGLPEEARVSGEEEDTGRNPDPIALGLLGRTEEPTECHLNEGDANTCESPSNPSSEPGLEAQPRAAVLGWEQARAQSTPEPGVMSLSGTQATSLDPDPVWVSKLLKKMETAFMAHLASALSELQARWSLQGDNLLDHMVAELQQDVGQRLRDSTDKELQKIQSRAGRTALRGQASLQTEQRRRWLQGLRNFSAFPEQNLAGEPQFLTLEDRPSLSAVWGAGPGGGAEGDEFCPCETCVRKKVTPKSRKATTGATSAPIKIAFDLRQILQQKREEAAEGTPKRIGTERLQEDHPDQGPDGEQELGLGPGNQRQSSDPSLREAEGAGEQEREEEAEGWERGKRTPASVGSAPEEVAEGLEPCPAEQEGAASEGSRDGDAPEAAGQRNGAEDTEGHPQSEAGRDSEEEGGPGASTAQEGGGEASGHSSLDQEGRPMTPPAQAEDTPHQGPGSQMSLGSCSQVSQKDLEDQSGRELGCPESPQAEGKVAIVDPDSSTSEEGGPPSGPGTPEPGAGEGCSALGQDQGAARGCAGSPAGDGAGGFGEDILDF
ncbi:retinitis pigmentosa 1-like 1 protein isoform X2 [Cavia porcellus]|uniref:retinitis pigmentosa 1-like 1 protein isoform X2 n=1 Tax=Cavia porcellus TaxID=10141 RepID=UPI002FE1FAFA